MSLILDALKRADAERASGTVPDLHAQPLGLGDEPRAPRAAGRRSRALGIGAAGLAGALVVAALLWWLGGAEPAEPMSAGPGAAPAPSNAPARDGGGLAQVPPAPTTAPRAAPAVPAAAVAPAPQAAPPAPVVQAAPAVPAAQPAPAAPANAGAAVTGGPAAQPRGAAATTATVATAATAATTTTAATGAPGTPAANPTGSRAQPPAPSGRSGAEPRVLGLAEVPDETRRALPALRFGGAVNSPDPASRMLIVDGLLMREGDEVAPGVLIRQIRLRSVVLEFRGLRIEVPY